ncbi:sensor histidine kinase [Limnofasciculus baicalensis]|uniref:histidine kinase n=1 Tax=Limnofasciculus baicalensis BBK-W-15 TaxID=2699891 RepID=A0AAE3GXA0_9CYAN|nr:ATP-binding protein [Limnofasciculus baicalensis]MCP2732305.1 ATP-binding protein [Limnofasciculus baicalensis BBK-W-15]
MLSLQKNYQHLLLPPQHEMAHLTLDSTLQELSLYNISIDASQLGKDVSYLFQLNPLLPGVILTQEGKFAGMISRRRFLEQMSRPYGLELFLKRPLGSLYRFVNVEVLKFRGDTKIVEAVRSSLQRSPELLYEPIVVEVEPNKYQLLDIHQLLIAQSQIHELATQLLHEQTQAQMMQTEKMASLGKMVAEVAHEMKNPLGCISGNFEFISNYCAQLLNIVSAYELEVPQISHELNELKIESELEFISEDLPKIIKSMTNAAKRLTQIVRSLNSFSHMDESKRQPADIHECIDNTLIILNNYLKGDIKLIKNYGNLPPVNCYSGQLSQVFMNIISNAIDALTDKIKDRENSSTIWQPKIEIHTTILEVKDRECVSVRITDNGPGIPLAIQQRIFESFFTTKPVGKGTGLGLAISHQIVTEKHGGQLLMKSEPDIGTEFQILLPLVA